MTAFDATLDRLNWVDIGLQLDAEGYAVLPGLLGADAARDLARLTSASGADRVALASSGLGRGELLVFGTGLPAPLEQWRTALYRRLVIVANRWNEAIGVDHRYPAELEDFSQRNRKAGQTRGQSHLSRLSVEDHVLLHQRNEGEQVFPMQIVAVLSEPGVDFQGGEFVLTEQRPRMQSRPAVLPLSIGDVAVITTAERPFKGTKGYYRVNLKHAISRVRKGERIGLELSFHDAP
ncbi:2OG-Fe(II) oxygenase [Cupriavidus metallidurans]|uniref:2OG-Fe(II) oxygenase n=1 Tax=Cupriavidus metallidurans TaxID=119219 RepID=UPI001CCB92AD|nr:2OG-Fe(II) oxygenase [Cupriavidus metallidurans]UBM08803.1 2OG-Fe(II) oxygenase [Cupriavidus metallidurans]